MSDKTGRDQPAEGFDDSYGKYRWLLDRTVATRGTGCGELGAHRKLEEMGT